MPHTRRAFTVIEALSAFACTGIITILGYQATAPATKPAATRPDLSPAAALAREADQLRKIHQSLVTFANASRSGRFPTPGLIDRLPTNLGGKDVEIPGQGPEDVTQNTTANLYSCMIAQNYFEPGLAVAPRDRNLDIKVDADYDFSKYNPAQDTYWDDAFKADLAEESNASFAHIALHGDPKATQWKSTLDSKYAVLGNRVPIHGKLSADSFACQPDGSWSGHVVFNDNHVEHLTVTTPQNVHSDLSFTKSMTADGPVLQFD
jgi:hypothetical protein